MTALAAVLNLGAYFFSDRLVLRLHGAREVSAAEAPGLHAIVEETAARAGIPKPRVFVMDADHANAFATGRNPSKGAVAVTAGLLRLMPPRELRGVIAHEIAHIRNRDILVASVAAAIASAVAHLANVVQWGALLGAGGARDEGEDGGSLFGALALALVAPIAATLVQLGISRSREYLADEAAARLTGDPEGLARALTRLTRAAAVVPPVEPEPATASLFIVNPFAGGGVLALFSTHPPAEERIARLLAMAGLARVA
jgi:heat shock protein HtpX